MRRNDTTDPLPILADLIRCPSITPIEGGALSYLEAWLGARGFTCTRLPFAEVDNLYARIGTSGPHLCFAGHTDVVPPGDLKDWSYPPFAAETTETHIYGRGASDMKGSVAAFCAAAADVIEAQGGKLRGSLSLLITGDEEGPADNGTVKVLEWMKANGHVPDHCLVGEPTCGDKLGEAIKIGRRGSLSFTIIAEGVQGHVAYPHKARNPLHALSRLVDRLATNELDRGNDHFDPSSLQVTSIDTGNPAGNVVPARATARMNIRFNTEHTFDSLRARVKGEADAVAAEFGVRFLIETSEGAQAFVTEPGAFVGIVQDAVAEETGIVPKLSTSGGTSDARFIKDYCPVLEFGPTNGTIHQVDERISIAELRATARIYRGIIEGYFSASAE
jgi:succinyl-diaminopimelate desuccinylase